MKQARPTRTVSARTTFLGKALWKWPSLEVLASVWTTKKVVGLESIFKLENRKSGNDCNDASLVLSIRNDCSVTR